MVKMALKKVRKMGLQKLKKRVQQRWNQAQKVEDIRVFVRNKNVNQNIYTVATKELAAFPIKNGYFQVKRIPDDLVVVAYSTGSVNFSGLSYDKDGNYFDLDMSLLEPGYSYEISFMRISGGITKELSNKFKFRVD